MGFKFPNMRSEINTIIFSKNRACQLELLLRSLSMPATVLYACDPEFKAGYDKLIEMYPSVKFIHETNFKDQLLKIIKEGEKYVMFLVDDDIMIDPFYENCPEFAEFKRNPEIICLSLRMSPVYCYKGLPIFKDNKWEWRIYSPGGRFHSHHLRNWGYPMSVGSHIFRKEDILPVIISAKKITTPNYLEGALSANIVPNRSLMICFDKPKVINNMANQVQSDFPCGNFGISVKELEEKFLKGERLSLEDIKAKASEARDCFLKTDYKWETNNNNWLIKYKKNRFSQRGEDGILAKIFEVLEIKRGWCVDVGAYGRSLSNTYTLMEQGWSGVLIEANEERHLKLKARHQRARRDAYCICDFVEPSGDKSLDNLLKVTPLPKDFGLLSIDIDGNDYYIWESLKNYSPQVVVIEFNSISKFTDYLQPINGDGGASLSIMVKLGKLKGYELISATAFNAFFVKKDLFEKFGIENNSPEELWTPDQRDKEYVKIPV